MEELDFIHSPSVNKIEVTIPPIRVLNVPNIKVFNAPSVPNVTVPVTVYIGKPIVDLPGCVEAHPEDEGKSPSLVTDDSDGTVVLCDGQYPSFDAMDYVPEDIIITTEAPPPDVVPPPDPPGAPEVPETTDLGTEEQPCPAPGQPRVGDLSQSGDEKVIGHELQGTTCVVLYEPTTAIEKYLPTTNVVTTTAVIATVATASALFAKPLADLILRALKPLIKKATDTVKKKLGRHRTLSPQEIRSNKYREKKGLPPLKVPKKNKKLKG